MIKNKLGIKFNSEPVYDKTYIKAKVREFKGKLKTNFLYNEQPKDNMHYTCIASITIDSVMRIVRSIASITIDSVMRIDKKKKKKSSVSLFRRA